MHIHLSYIYIHIYERYIYIWEIYIIYIHTHTQFTEPFPQEFGQFTWTWSPGDEEEIFSKGGPSAGVSGVGFFAKIYLQT